MRWPKRIGTKLGLVFAGLFALTMLLIAAALHMVVTERATVTVADEMTASGAVFSRLFLDKAADKQADAQLLAKDFGFRAAATSADPPTIASALENLAIRLGTTSLALIDTDGMVLGAVGKRLPLDKLTAHLDLSDDAALVDNKTGVLFAQDTPYLAGVAEVRAPNLVSWIVFGDEITSQKIAELNALSALNFNARLQLVDRNSLPPSTARQVGQDIVFARLAPSLLDTQRSQLVLTYPIADALRPYRSLAGVLLIVMLGCGAGVAGISWVVARRLAQPISDLSIAATALRDGQSAQVVVRSQDELGDLARAFNDMSGEIARREEDLRTQALTDRETGLPNRRAFEHALEAIQSDRCDVHVLAIGLERYAEINALIGIELCAKLLAKIGQRLARADAHIEHIACLSGGILAALIKGPTGTDILAKTAAIRAALEDTFMVEGTAIDVQFKIGISSPCAQRSGPLRDAVMALEKANATYTDDVVFDPTSAPATADNLSLMGDLIKALERGHVFLVYQPKYDLRSGAAVGVEALVRWEDPARGMVFPDQFIPLAEESGRIDALSRYVLTKALEAQQTLWQAGHQISLSVNVSGRLIGNQAFCDFALDAAQTAVGPLCFEITETAVIADPAKGMAAIARFAEAGIEISIDDYGSGLSSLAYLKQIPARELKIDKEFVLQIDQSQRDALLVRSTIDLAHSLGMKVTAEGIETAAAASLLAGMGCDIGQGYGLARPMDLAALMEHLKTDEPTLETQQPNAHAGQ